jgi:hypothetical protein
MKNKILIGDIDYITLLRDGSKVIFHLIDNKTYVINHNKLEKVAACVCASYFYDKNEINVFKDTINRQISVIVVNENFPIVSRIEKISDFYLYR